DVVDWQPPVQLAHRRRVPRVAMGMVGIANTGCEVAVARDHAEPRYVLAGPLEIAAEVLQEGMDEPARGGVMNEPRLEGCADLHIALARHLVLRAKRGDVADRVLDHPPRMLG